jgi:hypothetical protein
MFILGGGICLPVAHQNQFAHAVPFPVLGPVMGDRGRDRKARLDGWRVA